MTDQDWAPKWRPVSTVRTERVWRPAQAWRALHPVLSAFGLTLSALLAGLLCWAAFAPFLAAQGWTETITGLLSQLQLGQDFLAVSMGFNWVGQLAGSGWWLLIAALVLLGVFVNLLHRATVNAYRARYGRELGWRSSLLRQLVTVILLPVVALACLAALDALLGMSVRAQPLPNWLAAVVWLFPFLPAFLLFLALLWLALPNRLLGINSLIGAVSAWLVYIVWSAVVLGWLLSPDAGEGSNLPRLLVALLGFWLAYAVAVYVSYIAHPTMRGDYEARSVHLPFGEQVSTALGIIGRLDSAQTSEGYHDWLGERATLRGAKGDRREVRAVVGKLEGAGYLARRPIDGASQLQMNPADGSIGDFLATFGNDWSATANSRGMNAIRTLIDPALDRPLSDLLTADGLRGTKAQAIFNPAAVQLAELRKQQSAAKPAEAEQAFEAAKRAADEIAELMDRDWADKAAELHSQAQGLVEAKLPTHTHSDVALTSGERPVANPRHAALAPQAGGQDVRPQHRGLQSEQTEHNLADIKRAIEAARAKR